MHWKVPFPAHLHPSPPRGITEWPSCKQFPSGENLWIWPPSRPLSRLPLDAPYLYTQNTWSSVFEGHLGVMGGVVKKKRGVFFGKCGGRTRIHLHVKKMEFHVLSWAKGKSREEKKHINNFHINNLSPHLATSRSMTKISISAAIPSKICLCP